MSNEARPPRYPDALARVRVGPSMVRGAAEDNAIIQTTQRSANDGHAPTATDRAYQVAPSISVSTGTYVAFRCDQDSLLVQPTPERTPQ